MGCGMNSMGSHGCKVMETVYMVSVDGRVKYLTWHITAHKWKAYNRKWKCISFIVLIVNKIAGKIPIPFLVFDPLGYETIGKIPFLKFQSHANFLDNAFCAKTGGKMPFLLIYIFYLQA